MLIIDVRKQRRISTDSICFLYFAVVLIYQVPLKKTARLFIVYNISRDERRLSYSSFVRVHDLKQPKLPRFGNGHIFLRRGLGFQGDLHSEFLFFFYFTFMLNS